MTELGFCHKIRMTVWRVLGNKFEQFSSIEKIPLQAYLHFTSFFYKQCFFSAQAQMLLSEM